MTATTTMVLLLLAGAPAQNARPLTVSFNVKQLQIANSPQINSATGEAIPAGRTISLDGDRQAAKPLNISRGTVSDCMLEPAEIITTMQLHLVRINSCVESERSRSKYAMPPQLPLEFVVRPNGRCVEFRVGHRHYRTGKLAKCMRRSFKKIRFPISTGSACPITLPITIQG